MSIVLYNLNQHGKYKASKNELEKLSEFYYCQKLDKETKNYYAWWQNLLQKMIKFFLMEIYRLLLEWFE